MLHVQCIACGAGVLRWSPNLLSVCDLFSLHRPGLCRPDRLTCMQASESSSASGLMLVLGGTYLDVALACVPRASGAEGLAVP